MPSLIRSAFIYVYAWLIGSLAAATFTYHVAGDDPGPWPSILSSIGLTAAAGGPANLVIVRNVAPGSVPQWIQRVEQGELIVLEGDSELAQALGFRSGKKHVVVRSIVDRHAPKLPIVWQTATEIRAFDLPPDAKVFAMERWEGAPVMAAVQRGSGAALWIAVPPGEQGYERFPYLLQALHDLGMNPPFRSERLWAFFDGSYRSRVDLDYFADRWRKSGIGALHVAGWHYYEPDPENDAYLRRLIEACHRKAILVYVWLELPHVSERFWADHPEWREKTAILQDAQLDWRKLMNLTNRQAFAEVSKGIQALIARFDWDGVNLAELYFESLEGAANAARFTPMNSDVRTEFGKLRGFDPIELFQAKPDAEKLRAFLDYRADLAKHQQEAWIAQIEAIRQSKPDLDFVLTHVDDRFDTRMRDLIGADAAAARSARLHVLDRRPGHHLESGTAALPENRRKVSAPDQSHRQAGHRHQHRGALPGRLSHQATNRHGIVRAGAHGLGRLPARGAVFREFDPRAGSASAGFGGRGGGTR
jgi:hypothetical protein